MYWVPDCFLAQKLVFDFMYKFTLFFLFLSHFSFSQLDPESCIPESDIWNGKTIEKGKDNPNKKKKKIYLHIQDDIGDFIYLKLTNHYKKKIKYDHLENGKFIVIQEAKNKNNEWKEIEYFYFEKEGFPNKTYLRSLKKNEYIISRQKKYIEGDYSCDIRFKWKYKNRFIYSDSYRGKINLCQFKPPKDKDVKFILSNYSIFDKIEFLKKRIKHTTKKSDKKNLYFQQLILFLIREKKFDEAYKYAKKFKKKSPKSGLPHVSLGKIYVNSARHCYPEDEKMQLIILKLAFDEWKKGLAYEDSKKKAQTLIDRYKHIFENAKPSEHTKKIKIKCWINKTVETRYF